IIQFRGVLVSGGSAANLTGLTVARNVYFDEENGQEEGLFNQAPFVVYSSDQAHSCIDKSVQMLGIGTNRLRKVWTNKKTIRSIIQKDIPLQRICSHKYGSRSILKL